MEKRIVKLRAGLTVGGVQHTEAEIREMTVEDVLEANKPNVVMIGNQAVPLPPSENERAVRLAGLRVTRIGSIENPGPIHIKQLSFDDHGRIDAAMEELDKMLAAWAPAGSKDAGR